MLCNYRYVTWISWHLKSPATWLFRLTSITSKLSITGIGEGNPRAVSTHKGPVKRIAFPCHVIVMISDTDCDTLKRLQAFILYGAWNNLKQLHRNISLTHWGWDEMDDIFKRIFLNENHFILIQLSQKYVSRGPIINMPASVKIMAWRQTGDKPLSEPKIA